MCRQVAQSCLPARIDVLRRMRVHTRGAGQAGTPGAQVQCIARLFQRGCRNHDVIDARAPGTGHHLVEIAAKLSVQQVRADIDHSGRTTFSWSRSMGCGWPSNWP